MFRRLEKKFNIRIINMLTAGTSIDTSDEKNKNKISHKLKKFFKEGLNQLSKDVTRQEKKKNTTTTIRTKIGIKKQQPKKKTFRERLGFRKNKPKKKTFRERLGFKD